MSAPVVPANVSAAKPAAGGVAPAALALAPAPEGMVNVFVDGVLLQVKKGSTVMSACTAAAKEIPHFCFHERLSIAGNCRMCLVEIEGMPKPVASCHWPVAEGMKIKTDSKMTIEARKGTMELLLINHPLDCPICDQGGECELQDQAVAFGSDRSHYHEFKRAVDDKEIGSKIKTVMTRCIHCTRCVRFATEIAGVEEFGATGRGENMQVGTYVEQALQSELAGNMIDLCPVGALTSKPYAFTARPWELERHENVDVLDAVGTPVFVDVRAGQVMRVLPQECAEVNEEWLTDAARFSYDALGSHRVVTSLVKGKEVGWGEAFAALKKIFAEKPKVGGVFGAMGCAEDAVSFGAFMAAVGGVFDYKPSGMADVPLRLAGKIVDLDHADAVLMVGCNLRREAPLLNVRVRRGVLKRKLAVGVIGQAVDLTYKYEHLGDGAAALLRSTVSLRSQGASQGDAARQAAFWQAWGVAKNPMILVGMDVLQRADAGAVLAACEKLGKVSVVADTLGRVTAQAVFVGQELGQNVSNTAKILKDWQSGKIEVLVVCGEDTVTAAELKGGKGKLVFVGTHVSPLAKLADVVLPAAAWSEKAGTYVSMEGRVTVVSAAVKPPLNAKEEWKIWRALSEELGCKLDFDTLTQVRERIRGFEDWLMPPVGSRIRGKVEKEVTVLAKGLGTKKFDEYVTEYYVRLEYLRQSAVMRRMQGEMGLRVKK